jgi:hypothetical protein
MTLPETILVSVGLDGGGFGGLLALKGGQGGGEIVAGSGASRRALSARGGRRRWGYRRRNWLRRAAREPGSDCLRLGRAAAF